MSSLDGSELPRSLMARPTAGSANPSVSLDAVWRILQPALDHYVHHSSDANKPPALEPAYHMEIHTVIYNYFTSQSDTSTSQRLESQQGRQPIHDKPSSIDLYCLLDRYFQSITQNLLLEAPKEDSALLEYYTRCWRRYSPSVQAIHRLLNYFNRHYVKRAQDEDRGWLRLTDILDTEFGSVEVDCSREKLSQKLRERRLAELKDWGFKDGQSEEELAQAETCAEAASTPDRVVHVNALGFRRWRIEFVEPLLSVPKIGTKANRSGRSQSAKRPLALRSRFARAIDELLDSGKRSVEDRRSVAEELSSSLRKVGVRHDHHLRRRLDKFLLSSRRT